MTIFILSLELSIPSNAMSDIFFQADVITNTMIDKNIIYLSHGNVLEYNRAVVSILSFLSWHQSDLSKIRIIIYTDDPSYFKLHLSGFEVTYFLLTAERMADMLNGTGFLHRIKVSVIDTTFKNYPGQQVLFLDSDTFFFKNPAKLMNVFSSDKSWMHVREYKFEQAFDKFDLFDQGQFPLAFTEYINNRKFLVKDQLETFTLQNYSWNSGVLGLSESFSEYMATVLQLTDEFYANSKWFLSEQLAFSLVLQKTTEIIPCDDIIVHYWGIRQKELMSRIISEFLSSDSITGVFDKENVRRRTNKWRNIIEADLIVHQLLIATSNRHYYYGVKQIIKLAIKYPLSLWSLLREYPKKNKSKSI